MCRYGGDEGSSFVLPIGDTTRATIRAIARFSPNLTRGSPNAGDSGRVERGTVRLGARLRSEPIGNEQRRYISPALRVRCRDYTRPMNAQACVHQADVMLAEGTDPASVGGTVTV